MLKELYRPFKGLSKGYITQWSGFWQICFKTKFCVLLTKLEVSRRFQPAIYIHSFWRGIRIRGPKCSNPAGKPQNFDFKISNFLCLNPIRGYMRLLIRIPIVCYSFWPFKSLWALVWHWWTAKSDSTAPGHLLRSAISKMLSFGQITNK